MDTKKVYKQAQKELNEAAKQRQVDLVRFIIQKTSEKKEALEEKIKDSQETIEHISLDLKQLKDGFLKEIRMRHKNDMDAMCNRVFSVEKIKGGWDIHASGYTNVSGYDISYSTTWTSSSSSTTQPHFNFN